MPLHACICICMCVCCVYVCMCGFICVFIELKQLLTQYQEENNIHSPDEHELKGAIRGLGRLQSIYNINANEIANGRKYG